MDFYRQSSQGRLNALQMRYTGLQFRLPSMPKTVSKWTPKQKNLKRLNEKIAEAIYKSQLFDIIVETGRGTFLCNRLVLHSFTEFFMDFDDKVCIILSGNTIHPEAFSKIYEWMLDDHGKVPLKGFMEIFVLAHFFVIPALIRQIWHMLDDPQMFSEYDAYNLYMKTKQYSVSNDIQKLKEMLLGRIGKFFMTLVASADWLNLDADEVYNLLSLNSIGTNVEPDVLFAAVRWLAYNWPVRERYVEKIISRVRFSLMPLHFLVALNRGTECDLLNCIVMNKNVKRQIRDGITGATALHYQKTIGQKPDGFRVEPERRRVKDGCCPYLENPQTKTSYEFFIEYMTKIQENGAIHMYTVTWTDEKDPDN